MLEGAGDVEVLKVDNDGVYFLALSRGDAFFHLMKLVPMEE